MINPAIHLRTPNQRPAILSARGMLCALIRLYRWFLSPLIMALSGPLDGCRFTPTCSQYAIDAIHAHGAAAGSVLAFKRICRCHPFGGCGHDPVPGTLPKTEGRPHTF